MERNAAKQSLVIQLAQQLFDRVIPKSRNRESIAPESREFPLNGMWE